MVECAQRQKAHNKQLEKKLKELDERLEQQLGQLRRQRFNPTLRWVFQLFQAVHLLNVDGAKRIANLTEERKHILSFLVPDCRRYYLCPVQ